MGIELDITYVYAAVLLIAYLLGSIPFGVIIAPLFKVDDLRDHGSGNIGATNAMRVGGKKLGLTVLLLDALKGVLAVLITCSFTAEYETTIPLTALAGLCAVAGHIFPIWLGFKGGKGVATAIAVAWTVCWPVGLATTATWFVVFVITRVSALAAIIAMIAKPAVAFLYIDVLGVETLYICLIISVLVIFRHKENIQRLIANEENRF